jgi:glycosyltransferase involved in cell wall biosynthesis
MQEAEEDLPASMEYLQSVVEEVKPELLHLNQFCYGALRTDVPRIVVAHSDVVSWWVSVHGQEPRDSEWMRWYRRIVGEGLAAATTVVAPSRWMLEESATYYGRHPRGTVIYNGRSPNLFNPHMTKEDAVMAVGRLWDGGKQVSLMLDVDAPVQVWIAGSEEHADRALRGGAGLGSGAASRVQFKGMLSEGQIRHLYGRAAIYAATARYEPFGLAPLEAALSRCVLVANDIPSLREIWGDTALYFERNNAHSLSETVRRVCGNRETRLTYSNLAYNRARQRFTAERMADDYMALYRSMVPQGVSAV